MGRIVAERVRGLWRGGAACLWLAGMAANALAAEPGTRPHVVLVVVDALRADRLGCYGFTENTSPELDALAAQGVRFSRALASCSWTRPSMGAMLTARQPRSLGLYEERNEILDDRFDTLAELLRASGYATVGATANPITNSVFNMGQGFDRYADSNVVLPWMGVQTVDGKTVGDWRREQLPFASNLFDKVIADVQAYPGRPCFVLTHVMEVHEAWRGSKSLTRPEYAARFKGRVNRGYLAAVRQVSADIGVFVQRVIALPGWEDTLFVITSDHGQGLKSHPHVPLSTAHGRYLYESHLMVPLIFYRSNGVLAPRSVDRPVRLLDLMPTVLDYLGLPVPAGLDGRSLRPLLEGEESDCGLPEAFVAETQYRAYDKVAVYVPEWKYIENRDRRNGMPPQELQRFGIAEDGKRTSELDAQPDVVARLKAFLTDWENRMPRVSPTPLKGDLSCEERGQLKAIGYLD